MLWRRRRRTTPNHPSRNMRSSTKRSSEIGAHRWVKRSPSSGTIKRRLHKQHAIQLHKNYTTSFQQMHALRGNKIYVLKAHSACLQWSPHTHTQAHCWRSEFSLGCCFSSFLIVCVPRTRSRSLAAVGSNSLHVSLPFRCLCLALARGAYARFLVHTKSTRFSIQHIKCSSVTDRTVATQRSLTEPRPDRHILLGAKKIPVCVCVFVKSPSASKKIASQLTDFIRKEFMR